jgi:hypothetical protein
MKEKMESSKNDTKCIKKAKNKSKNGGISYKERQKRANLRKLNFLLFYMAICFIFVVTNWCLNTMEGYYELYDIVYKQSMTIDNLLEWLHSNENVVNFEENAEADKQQAYNLTNEERELLAKLLYHEARGESIECQKAVVSVVLNRVDSGIWGNTLSEVIYAKNQFEPVGKGLLPNTKPLQNQYEAIDYVIENGATIPSNVLYFRADHYFEWGTDYMNIDNTYFSI